MARNLDMTALRAFVTVAEAGGVTKAAGMLHLTQSAVSMQLKRMEDALGHALFNRVGRRLELSRYGEQLLSYGRQILALNDEVWGRMTEQEFEGEIRLGVPADIVYPHIPNVLQQFSSDFPKVKINLISSFTSSLKQQFARGDVDIILTTEQGVDPGGETMAQLPLVWVGACGGTAWKQRPLRLAFENSCIMRAMAQSALDAAGIRWEMAVDSDSTRSVEAITAADLGICAVLEDVNPQGTEDIRHDGSLPTLPVMRINKYVADGPIGPLARKLGEMIRSRYQGRMAA